MILKGSQRGGAGQLATHLLKTEENEHVEVHEVRGFVSDDLPGALKEAYAVSCGTKCKQPFFSVTLNPPEHQRVDVDDFMSAVDAVEQKTGLQGQPRAIVFHEKEGRRHAHAVWSRIDAETMTARNLPYFKLKLRDISRQLYREHEWTMPRGLMDSKAADPRNFSLSEWQQAKRMGLDARDLKAVLQDCWTASDTRAAFQHALAERGLLLAKGDRRGHVAVTHSGEVLSVARYTGKKAKEVRAKLGDPANLPPVDVAKAQMASDMTAAFNRQVIEARQLHSKTSAKFAARRAAMAEAHRKERQKLDLAQRQRWGRETLQRQARFRKGVSGVLDWLTGIHARTRKNNEIEAYASLTRDRKQRDALVAAQLQERQRLQDEIKAARQRQARLLSDLRRDRQQQKPAEKTRRKPTPHAQDRITALRSKAAPQRDKVAIKQETDRKTGADERLQRLRNAKPKRTRGPGFEPER